MALAISLKRTSGIELRCLIRIVQSVAKSLLINAHDDLRWHIIICCDDVRLWVMIFTNDVSQCSVHSDYLSRRSEWVKVEVMDWLMNRYDTTHEHDNHRDSWLSLVEERAAGRKTLRYVAIIEGFNHRQWREPIKRSHCSGNEEQARTAREKRYLPAGNDSYLLLRFYDT